jgi:hypothetical protein
MPGWLPAMIGLGLVAGIVVVAVAFLIGRPEAPSTASFAPSFATLTPTSGPGSGEPPTSGDPSATLSADGTPILVPGSPLGFTGATASSVIGNREKFAPQMAIDGDLTTCWQEGTADEAGQWIEVGFLPARVDAVIIRSGYQLSEDAFFANRRPREVRISVGGQAPLTVVLEDTMAEQRIELGGLSGEAVRIELVTTWDPRATAYPGSPFDDTAISEIVVIGVPAR